MREEPTKTNAVSERGVFSRRMYRPEHSPEKRSSSFLRLHTVGDERVLSETNFQATREREQQRFNSSSFETRDEEKEKEERSESVTRREEASSSNAILERFLKKLERDFQQGEKKNGVVVPSSSVRSNTLKIVFKIRKRRRMTRSICCEKLWRNPNRLSRTRE